MRRPKDSIKIICLLKILLYVLCNAECYSPKVPLPLHRDTLAPKVSIDSFSFKNYYSKLFSLKSKNEIVPLNDISIKPGISDNISNRNNFWKELGKKLIRWIKNIINSQGRENSLPTASISESYGKINPPKQDILKHIGIREHSELYHLKMFGKDIWVLGAPHCHETLAISRRYVLSKIRMKEKNDWLFLIEGDIKNNKILRDNPEIKGVYNFAKTHDIDIMQAVTSNVDRKVTALFLTRNLGTRSELFWASFVQLAMTKRDITTILESILAYGNKIKDPKQLLQAMEESKEYLKKIVNDEAPIDQLVEQFQKIYLHSIELSNEITKEYIKSLLLNQYKDKKNVFIQMGYAHLPSIVHSHPTIKQKQISNQSMSEICKNLLKDISGIIDEAKRLLNTNTQRLKVFKKFPELNQFSETLNEYRKNFFNMELMPSIVSSIGDNEKLWRKLIDIANTLSAEDKYSFYEILGNRLLEKVIKKLGNPSSLMPELFEIIASINGNKKIFFLEDVVLYTLYFSDTPTFFLRELNDIGRIFNQMPSSYNYPIFNKAFAGSNKDIAQFKNILRSVLPKKLSPLEGDNSAESIIEASI